MSSVSAGMGLIPSVYQSLIHETENEKQETGKDEVGLSFPGASSVIAVFLKVQPPEQQHLCLLGTC